MYVFSVLSSFCKCMLFLVLASLINIIKAMTCFNGQVSYSIKTFFYHCLYSGSNNYLGVYPCKRHHTPSDTCNKLFCIALQVSCKLTFLIGVGNSLSGLNFSHWEQILLRTYEYMTAMLIVAAMSLFRSNIKLELEIIITSPFTWLLWMFLNAFLSLA